MSHFLSNIIQRHTSSEHSVKPRGKSTFESNQPISNIVQTPMFEENVQTNTNSVYKDMEGKQPIHNIHQIETIQDNVETNEVQDLQNQNIERPKVTSLISPVKSENRLEAATTRIVNEMKSASVFFAEKNKSLEIDKRKSIIEGSLNTRKMDFSENQSSELKINDLNSTQEKIQHIAPQILNSNQQNIRNEIHQKLVSNFDIYGSNSNDTDASHIHSANGPQTKSVQKAPTIKVQIGRIDIKAVKQTPVKQLRSQKQQKSESALEKFLNKRADRK